MPKRRMDMSRVELGDRVAAALMRENQQGPMFGHKVIRHRANLAIALDGRHPLVRRWELKTLNITDCP